MNWICPKSEEGWAELLSAYVDGELSAHEAEALRAYFDPTPRARGPGRGPSGGLAGPGGLDRSGSARSRRAS